MSLRGAFFATKQSPYDWKVASGYHPRSDMQRIETERAIVHGNRELIRLI